MRRVTDCPGVCTRMNKSSNGLHSHCSFWPFNTVKQSGGLLSHSPVSLLSKTYLHYFKYGVFTLPSLPSLPLIPSYQQIWTPVTRCHVFVGELIFRIFQGVASCPVLPSALLGKLLQLKMEARSLPNSSAAGPRINPVGHDIVPEAVSALVGLQWYSYNVVTVPAGFCHADVAYSGRRIFPLL